MNIVLHVGEGKTGTTSIQQYLSSNRERLDKLGIIYLTPPSSCNHVCLAARLGAGVRVSPENLRAMQAGCDQLFEQLKQIALDPRIRSIVISVEHLFGVAPNLVLSYFRNYFRLDNFHIIAYVRDPVSQYVSRMQQMVKASYAIIPPHQYSRDVFSPVMRWIDSIGMDQVHVKPFSRKALVSEDVLVDFMVQLGVISGVDLASQLRHTTNHGELRHSNSGINVEQMSTVQCFRRIVFPDSNNLLHRRSTRMVGFFESLNNIGTLGSKPILKPALSAAVLANNESFIESLAALFPQFSSVMETLECGEHIPAREAYRGDVGYVSIADLFVDSSASVLNLYRFLCLPCCSKHKSPEVYLQGLNGLLDRCVCSNRISGFIRKYAKKMVSISQEKHLPSVQIF